MKKSSNRFVCLCPSVVVVRRCRSSCCRVRVLVCCCAVALLRRSSAVPSLVPLSLARRCLFRRPTCNVQRSSLGVQLSSFAVRGLFVVLRCIVPSSFIVVVAASFQRRCCSIGYCSPLLAVHALFAVARSLSAVVGQSSIVGRSRYFFAVSSSSFLHRSSFIVVASSLVLHRRSCVRHRSQSIVVRALLGLVRSLFVDVRSPFAVRGLSLEQKDPTIRQKLLRSSWSLSSSSPPPPLTA